VIPKHNHHQRGRWRSKGKKQCMFTSTHPGKQLHKLKGKKYETQGIALANTLVQK